MAAEIHDFAYSFWLVILKYSLAAIFVAWLPSAFLIAYLEYTYKIRGLESQRPSAHLSFFILFTLSYVVSLVSLYSVDYIYEAIEGEAPVKLGITLDFRVAYTSIILTAGMILGIRVASTSAQKTAFNTGFLFFFLILIVNLVDYAANEYMFNNENRILRFLLQKTGGNAFENLFYYSNHIAYIACILLTLCVMLISELTVSVTGRLRMHLKEIKGSTKMVSSVTVLALCLLGFYILDNFKAVIWLLFLIASYPVVLAFTASILDGTTFNPSQPGRLYRDSLRSLPIVGSLIRNLGKASK